MISCDIITNFFLKKSSSTRKIKSQTHALTTINYLNHQLASGAVNPWTNQKSTRVRDTASMQASTSTHVSRVRETTGVIRGEWKKAIDGVNATGAVVPEFFGHGGPLPHSLTAITDTAFDPTHFGAHSWLLYTLSLSLHCLFIHPPLP